MNKAKSVVSRILFSFALVGIGFALGKHAAQAQKPKIQKKTGDKSSYVAVYYTHGNVRCETCNTIESLAKALVKTHYKSELAKGAVRWQTVNFQKDSLFAKQFEILSSGLVIALVVEGKVQEHERLDEVWTLKSEPEEFDEYVSTAIDGYSQALRGFQ